MATEGQPNKWQLRFERERKARREAEHLLEEKSLALFKANQQLSQKVARQDDQIRAENERFRLVFETSLNGLLLHTPSGEILEANAMAVEMLKYSIDELLSLPLTELHHEDHHLAARSALEELNQKGSVRFNSKFSRKDGSTFRAEVMATRVQSEGNTLIQASIRDMTQEHRVLRQIKESQLESQKANEAKTHFLATMSHELLTPLNGLIGFADLLSESSLTNPQREHLDFVQHCSSSLHTLVRDLLDFSAIESGKITIERKNFALSPFLNLLTEIHDIQARKKGLNLRLSLSKHLPQRLYTDPARLQQIVANLISNALKYSSEGTVEVIAQLDGDHLEIIVRDEGPGLPSSEAEALFEPYVRGQQRTQRHNEGSGLGLAISRKLCTTLGGLITARNLPAGGAEFKVQFPLNSLEPAPSSPEQSPALAPDPTTAHSPCDTPILVAEDNPVNAQLIKLLLTKQGYPIVTASDGEEALQKLRQQNSFKILLADLNMPRRDGLSLTRAIRNSEAGAHYKELPIVAISANLLERDRERAIAAGMNAFLPKPIKKQELAQCLAKLFQPHAP